MVQFARCLSESLLAMSTRLTLLSHAPTPCLRNAAFPIDEELDVRGIASTTAWSSKLGHPRQVFASPTRRTLQTAALLNFDPEIVSQLDECRYGDWSGKSFADVAAKDPERLAHWTSDPQVAPPGGESVVELVARVGAWLDLRVGEKGHSLAITHSAVIRAAIVYALGVPPHTFWRIDVAPATCAELRPGGNRWTLRALGQEPGLVSSA